MTRTETPVASGHGITTRRRPSPPVARSSEPVTETASPKTHPSFERSGTHPIQQPPNARRSFVNSSNASSFGEMEIEPR